MHPNRINGLTLMPIDRAPDALHLSLDHPWERLAFVRGPRRPLTGLDFPVPRLDAQRPTGVSAPCLARSASRSLLDVFHVNPFMNELSFLTSARPKKMSL
jgi:hypothetical protein